jgi:hypothetical protein
MKLTEYTAKKTLGNKNTLKSTNGSYSSEENSAEVILTFTGDNIDMNEANRMAQEQAVKLLNETDEGSTWLNPVPEKVPNL